MAITELTQDQQKVKALLATHPHLSVGVGNEEEMCTIAAINMALTGRVSDDTHPCISPVIRGWVIVTQDAMPDAIRDSEAWRECVPLIAGSAASAEIERARVERIMAWMWDALGDDAFLPDYARQAWDYMLSERTTRAAHAAYVASGNSAAKYGALATRAAAKAAHAAAEAARATRAAAKAAKAAPATYWQRRDPAGMLAELVAMR